MKNIEAIRYSMIILLIKGYLDMFYRHDIYHEENDDPNIRTTSFITLMFIVLVIMHQILINHIIKRGKLLFNIISSLGLVAAITHRIYGWDHFTKDILHWFFGMFSTFMFTITFVYIHKALNNQSI
jgi:uracil DNA glycosylase